jgi:myxalamid-type polyketide synthase MxaE and MxaD
VHLLVADTGDARSLEVALAQYHGEGYPPIRGLVHAAGVLDTRLALQADEESMQRVWAPKAEGAKALDRLLPELERCVFTSSMSAAMGFSGMVAYAAANAALDALAYDRRLRGRHAVSIQSGSWRETGMQASDHAQSNMEQLRAQGFESFVPEDGVRVFSALASGAEACVLFTPIDWARFATARRGRDLRLYSGYEAVASAGSEGGHSLASQLTAAPLPERRKILEPVVRDAVARVLKLAPARVDARKPLGGMGLNSLMAMELRNRLEAALARPLSATLAWNYPTVEALVGFLAGDGKATPAPVAPKAPPTEPAAELATVAQLSDEDAARALRRKR